MRLPKRRLTENQTDKHPLGRAQTGRAKFRRAQSRSPRNAAAMYPQHGALDLIPVKPISGEGRYERGAS
jgi:hypothetical protein